MRKTSIILILLLLSSSIYSQYKPVVFGFRGGGGVSWMRSDVEGYDNVGVRPMGSWGFMAQFFLMENYSVLTGFNVNYLNSKLRFPHAMDLESDTVPTAGILTRNYKLQYVEIPLILRMKANIDEHWKIFGNIGLGTSFNIRARADDLFEYQGGEIASEKDISDEVKLMRQSFIIGGGVEYVFKESTSLLLDIRFNNGFVDILNGANVAYPSLDNKATISFIELNIGIIF